MLWVLSEGKAGKAWSVQASEGTDKGKLCPIHPQGHLASHLPPPLVTGSLTLCSALLCVPKLGVLLSFHLSVILPGDGCP